MVLWSFRGARSFMQVMLLSMMEKLSELRSKFEGEAFKLFIGGSTAGIACSMQGV